MTVPMPGAGILGLIKQQMDPFGIGSPQYHPGSQAPTNDFGSVEEYMNAVSPMQVIEPPKDPFNPWHLTPEDQKGLHSEGLRSFGGTLMAGANPRVPGGYDWSSWGKGVLAYQTTTNNLVNQIADRKIKARELEIREEDLVERRKDRQSEREYRQAMLGFREAELATKTATTQAKLTEQVNFAQQSSSLAIEILEKDNSLEPIVKTYINNPDIEQGYKDLTTLRERQLGTDTSVNVQDRFYIRSWLKDLPPELKDTPVHYSVLRSFAHGDQKSAIELARHWDRHGAMPAEYLPGSETYWGSTARKFAEGWEISTISGLLDTGHINESAGDLEGEKRKKAIARAEEEIRQGKAPHSNIVIDPNNNDTQFFMNRYAKGGYLDTVLEGVPWNVYANNQGAQMGFSFLQGGLNSSRMGYIQDQQVWTSFGEQMGAEKLSEVKQVVTGGLGEASDLNTKAALVEQVANMLFMDDVQTAVSTGGQPPSSIVEYRTLAHELINAEENKTNPSAAPLPIMLDRSLLPSSSPVNTEELMESQGFTKDEVDAVVESQATVPFQVAMASHLENAGDIRGLIKGSLINPTQAFTEFVAEKYFPEVAGSVLANVFGVQSYGALYRLMGKGVDALQDLISFSGDRMEYTDPVTGDTQSYDSIAEQLLTFALEGTEHTESVRDWFKRYDSVRNLEMETAKGAHNVPFFTPEFNDQIKGKVLTVASESVSALSKAARIYIEDHPATQALESDIEAAQQLVTMFGDFMTYSSGAPFEDELTTNLDPEAIKSLYALNAFSDEELLALAKSPGFLTRVLTDLVRNSGGAVYPIEGDVVETAPQPSYEEELTDLANPPIPQGNREADLGGGTQDQPIMRATEPTDVVASVGSMISKKPTPPTSPFGALSPVARNKGSITTWGTQQHVDDAVSRMSSGTAKQKARKLFYQSGANVAKNRTRDALIGEPDSSLKQRWGSVESQYNLPPGILDAIARTESTYRSGQMSNAHAHGMFQMKEDTAAQYGYTRQDLYDPMVAAEAAAKHLTRLRKAYGNDWLKLMAAWNAGEGTVFNKNKGMLPAYPETIDFINRIEIRLGGIGALGTLK